MKIYAKVDGQHYEFERPEVDSRGFKLNSMAKYCPLCLAGWCHMTLVINDEIGPRMKGYHAVCGQLCPRCGGQVRWQPNCTPGSLLEEPQTNCQTVDWDLLNYLPPQLLRREFDLHYEFLVSKQETQLNVSNTAAKTERWSGTAQYTSNVRKE